MQFVDQCKLILKAGNGGSGTVAWRREAHYPEGGPFGGDGGDGGDIIIVGDHNESSLFHLRYLRTVTAENGENGQTKMAAGKSGQNIILKVPLGTSIYDELTSELLMDILSPNQSYIICQGGQGGFGNAHFKSSLNKAPTLFENGDLGEEKTVVLKLKYLADVGLVGLPNAGKSTLITQISSARPKIASYQFTTVIPVLGVVNLGEDKLIFADIPGLIEDANLGKGLGHEFLKHIERCHILVHVISMDPTDNLDVIAAYETIMQELSKYKIELLDKPMIVVANKSDVIDADNNYEILKNYLNQQNIFLISALKQQGLQPLLSQIKQIFAIKKQQIAKQLEDSFIKVIEVKPKKAIDQDLKIEKVDEHTWKIASKWLEYWSQKIPLTTADNLIRFNQKMQTLKIEEKAKALGAVAKDTLIIYKNEFEVDK